MRLAGDSITRFGRAGEQFTGVLDVVVDPDGCRVSPTRPKLAARPTGSIPTAAAPGPGHGSAGVDLL
jgi:hypothetical protein